MPKKALPKVSGKARRLQRTTQMTSAREKAKDVQVKIDEEVPCSMKSLKRKTEDQRRAEMPERMKKLRNDQVYRRSEQERNTQAHRQQRKDPMKYSVELERNRSSNKAAQKTLREAKADCYEFLLSKFNEETREGPTNICACCGGLWYSRSVTEVSRQKLEERSATKEILSDILQILHNGKYVLCGTCYNSVICKDPKIPRLCVSNGFMFPVVPECLTKLTSLEERLVSPRIPFMQIRNLGFCGQGIKGNVVNVMNDLDVCAKVLPREINNCQTIQVMLMRRMLYKAPYMFETIRPNVVYEAAKYLATTELYKKEGIVLSDDWKTYKCESLNFVVEEGDLKIVNELNNGTSTSNFQESDSDSDEESDKISPCCDETLLLEVDDSLVNKIVKIAPGEGKCPISVLKDLEAQVLSFPKIYGGVSRKFKKGVKITLTDILKSEARRYDRRACTVSNLLYACKLLQTHRVANAISLCLRKKKGGQSVNAGMLKSPGAIENLISHDDGFRCLRGVRQSPAYMEVQQKKIMALIRQFGLPAFFITLSAAETKWPELLVNLERILNESEEEAANLTFAKKAELIRGDPITCARNFDHRNRSLLNNLLTKPGGIFAPNKVTDYFQKVENQLRGSPHSHGLYWIAYAPVCNFDDPVSVGACIQFIDTYITCRRYGDEELDSVIGYQIHRHSHACRRFRKGKKVCRFGLPKPPMPATQILHPLPENMDPQTVHQANKDFETIHSRLVQMGRMFLEVVPFAAFIQSLGLNDDQYILAVRSSLKRPTTLLKRETCDIFVNAYNDKLLKTWRANIDIQFILDPYACGKYCVSYIGKTSGGISKLLRQITDELRHGNYTLRERLRKIANCFLNCTEISAQEAAYWVLGMPFTSSSRQCVYVNTSPPEERTFLVKSSKELEELDDESEDIAEETLIDHYKDRADELSGVCLADFAAYYDYQRNHAKATEVDLDNQNFDLGKSTQATKLRCFPQKYGHGEVVQRFKAKVIRYRRYGKQDDPANYYREQCMLYLPWRDEQSDLLSKDTTLLYNIYKQEIEVNRIKYDPDHRPDDPEILSMIEDDDKVEHLKTTVEEDYAVDITASMSTKSKDERLDFIKSPRILDDEDYWNLIRNLNESQRKYFLHLISCIKVGQTGDLYDFIMGGAGVGKSHLITAIVQSIVRMQLKEPGVTPDNIFVLVCAATGKAAHNVRGITLHCAFKLPPNQYAGNLARLNEDICNSLRLRLKDLKLIIIDEISMLSLRQIHQISDRLQQIFDSKSCFGGVPILVVGDLRQIRPFGGKFVFESMSNSLADLLCGNVLWQKFRMFELTQIMRQKDDLRFAQAPNNMADGQMTEEDVALIRSRTMSPALQPPSDAIRLYGSNKDCDDYNAIVHRNLDTEEALSVAFDRIQGTCSESQRLGLLEYAKTLPTKDTDGLPREVLLKVGAIYMISLNVDVSDGLFNGSTGTLRGISYGKRAGVEIPVRVLMEFTDPYVGSSARSRSVYHQFHVGQDNKWTPVEIFHKALTRSGHKESAQIVREQIPLIPANGITFEKSQGSTYTSVVVCTKGRTRRDLIYVGCSRCTSLSGLYIDGDFNPPKPLEPLVANEILRLRANPLKLALRFLQDVPETHFKLIFHNVQSLHKHFLDVKADHCFLAADLMCLVEPWSLKNDIYEFQGFREAFRQDSGLVRNYFGSIVFAKPWIQTICSSKTNNIGNGHYTVTKIQFEMTTILIIYKSPTFNVSMFVNFARSWMLFFPRRGAQIYY